MRGARLFSFPKTRRLARTLDFDRVKEAGHAERGQFIVLATLAVQNSGASRAGFITSGRLGGAVVRNRVRRRLREIVRKHQHDLRDDFWIVVIARPGASKASYRALEDEWLRLAKRASILAL
ncbi:MAG TPA: ribonuclease P protein component [Candidatus Udaeobacter sp.]|nr:ribonuclease P protein component [Candidatus Udaeobacter sp.]